MTTHLDFVKSFHTVSGVHLKINAYYTYQLSFFYILKRLYLPVVPCVINPVIY
jgi:hypothetical protein